MERIAAFISGHPKRVIIGFSFVTAFLLIQLVQLRFDFTPQALFSKSASAYAFYASFVEEFGSDETLLIVVIQGDEIFTKRGIGLLDELTRAFDAIPYLKNTRSLTNTPEIRQTGKEELSILPFLDPPPETHMDYARLRERALRNPLYLKLYVSPDGKTAGIITQLVDEIEKVDQMSPVVEQVESIIARKSIEYPDFEIMVGGVPYIRTDMIRLLLRDLMLFVPVCLAMLIVVSFLMFRYIQGVVLPLVSVLFIVIWGLGILRLGGGKIDILTNNLPVLVMIIGVADSIHLLGRYDEEIQRGLTRKEAAYEAVRYIGVACLLTSFTTAIAFASLGISTNELLSQFGIYASFAILAAYVVTITLLPILLLRWGRGAVPSNGNPKTRDRLGRILDQCADICIHHRWLLFVAGLCIVAFSFVGALRTGMSNNILEFYSEDSPVYQSNLAMEESLAGIIPYSISFRGEQDLFKDPVFLEKLSALQHTLERDPLVGKTLSLADFVEEMHSAFNGEGASEGSMPASREAVAQYLLLFSMSGHEEELERLVNQDYSWGNIDVRCNSADSDIIGVHLNSVEGWIHSIFPEEETSFEVHLTGAGVFAYSTLDDLMGDMIRSIFMAVVIIFIVITLEFRSLRIGLISMIPNLIPVLLTYGAMGWMGIKLQLSTVVVFTISLGIAVDDSIHFLVRFREEFRKHGDHEQALRSAFQGAGKAIVHTTVILVLGLGVLCLSSLPPTARFAYLTATTLTSALLADLFVLPACIMIFKFKP